MRENTDQKNSAFEYFSCCVVAAVEKAFKLNVINTNKKFTNTRHLVQKISIDVVFNTNWSAYFPSTNHCFHVFMGFKDGHITKIV